MSKDIYEIISKYKIYMSFDDNKYEMIQKLELNKIFEEIERLNNIIMRNRTYLEKIIDDLIIPIYDEDTIKKYTGLSAKDVKNEFLKYYDKELIK